MKQTIPQTWAEKIKAMKVGDSLPVDKEQSVYSAIRRIADKSKIFTIRIDDQILGTQSVWRLK